MMGPLDLLKRFWLWFYLQMVGAKTILQEQIWDRHIFDINTIPNGKDRNVVITGGNRGIGFCAVKTFLGKGYRVVIGCRNPSMVTDQLNRMKEEGSLPESVSFVAYSLDLMDMESVRNFAKSVAELKMPIHVLANNAGIMFGPRKLTKNDGFESQLSTNYLGHFLLTSLLLPQLKGAGTADQPARIVNVSSVAHFVGSWMDLNDVHCSKFYSPEGAYGNSKAAQIMFTKFLDKKLQSEGEHVRVHSVHPGVVNTGLYDSHAAYLRMLGSFLMKKDYQGGDTIVYAALSPDLAGKGGTYIENTHVKASSSFTRDEGNQAELWALTCKMLHIEEFGRKE